MISNSYRRTYQRPGAAGTEEYRTPAALPFHLLTKTHSHDHLDSRNDLWILPNFVGAP